MPPLPKLPNPPPSPPPARSSRSPRLQVPRTPSSRVGQGCESLVDEPRGGSRVEEAQPGGGLVLPFRRHDEGHACAQEPASPFGVVVAGPARAPEQHHAQFRLADEL